MNSPKRYSLADVRASYSRDKAWAEMTGDLPVYLVYRPLSFPITWLLLRMRVPLLLVTLSGALVSIAMWPAALSGRPDAFIVVALLGICGHVLDCVDGNMARTRGQSSFFGFLLDGCVDILFALSLFGSLGLLVEHENAVWFAKYGFEIALLSTIAVHTNRRVRDGYTHFSHKPAVLGGPRIEKPSAAQWALYAVTGLENLYAPALLVFGAMHAMYALLAAAASYAFIVSIAAVVITLRQARIDDAADRLK